jgi:hypothetical protein
LNCGIRRDLPIALVVGVAFAPVCARAQSQLSLKSVSVDLPPGDDMNTAAYLCVFVSERANS